MKPLTRRDFLVRSVLAGVSAGLAPGRWALASDAGTRLMFAGTSTGGRSKSKGIYAYRWDTTSGTFFPLGLAAETPSPTYLALSPDKKFLFAANEISNFGGAHDGCATAFSVDHTTGRLTQKNVVSSGGAGPCNISVDHTGKIAFVADGAGGSLASYRVLSDGSLSAPITNLHFAGHSINPDRQKGAYTHCTVVSPDNRFVIVNDLGLDRITSFHFDVHTAELTANRLPAYEAIPGSGPRSFTFHPNHRWAYSINEILSTIDVLQWDRKKGTLTRLQNLPTAPTDFAGKNMPSTAQVERTGRYLYISNRGANTIGVFSIDQTTGTLKPMQQVSCGGSTPRHFTLDPTEQWLLAANQASGTISVLKRNPQSGLLTPHGDPYAVDGPMYLAFL